MTAYLEALTIRLASGIGRLPAEHRALHVQYLQQAQREDGGWAGREGASDLYYTGFALRGLAILGELYGPVAQRAAEFLRQRLTGRESIVDFFSLIYGAMLLDSAAGVQVMSSASPHWQDAVATTLEQLRRPDGGYAKAAEGAVSSTYHSFLVLLCQQLIQRPTPEPERLVQFLMSQRCEEGGFREIKASKRAGTNPTAAAIGALRILDAIDDGVVEDTVPFLLEMQTDEGGLRANTRIPIADLLSTFTGLLTLADLQGVDEVDLQHARRYVRSMEQEGGGFLGAAWDPVGDVEYTFYGLGCTALLAELLP